MCKIKTYTLYELNRLVRATLDNEMGEGYWVEAELAGVQERGGHCYMELIQKEIERNTPIAKARACCWRSVWAIKKRQFENITSQSLKTGLKVLILVTPQFHEAYGFSWIVNDIDPKYTLGDMAQKRLAIIRQLKEEGVFDLNKKLVLPLFCQRIAVISSATAAGYGDFCNQLNTNTYGYWFKTELFQSTMQGEDVERSIIEAFDKISLRTDEFDCVVIIRGGGATSDMAGFDALDLARNVANFPLPIITGIGHDRDECILDMVSYLRVKTPTAAAAFLIESLRNVESRIEEWQQRIVNYIKGRMETEKIRISRYAEKIPSSAGMLLVKAMHRIEILEERAKALDPMLQLKHGYSITMLNGTTIRDCSTVKEGDEIVSYLANGTVKSIVTWKK